MNPQVSVIISVYNNVEWLRMIFAALELQTFKNFEVVVADDGSGTEMVSELNRLKDSSPLQVKHVWHEDKGWQKNIILNKAIVTSESEYLIFIDGDCIPHHKMVEEHYTNRLQGRILAGRRVQLTQKLSDTLTVEKVKERKHERLVIPLLLAGFQGKERHVEDCIRIPNTFLRKWLIKDKDKGLLGCNFSIFKCDILKVNGFDERYLHPATGEDTDLEARLRRIGITPITKKHLLTVYHKKHIRKEIEDDPNRVLFQENNDNEVSWTPYGISREKSV